MKSAINLLKLLIVATMAISCSGSASKSETPLSDHGHEHEANHMEVLSLSAAQFEALELQVDSMPRRQLNSYVKANGQLEVPPQNEAAVTAIVGANIMSILVIEGDKVQKGQVLAYLSHPDLIKLQSDYVNSWNQHNYLEQEYERQKKLYEEKVSSGKSFQKTQADYRSMQGNLKGYEVQLKLMGLSLKRILDGNFYEQVPVLSPISGHVRLVEVKTGQYVQPQKEMFEIISIDHIHVDLMVFEKDMHKVKEGQKVLFSIESYPESEMQATIYAVGKSFEQDPKAIHLHADIENKSGLLIPGTYVRARIITDDYEAFALPEAAVVREDDSYFIFKANSQQDEGHTNWIMEPIAVSVGSKYEGWIEIIPKDTSLTDALFVWNNAYYLMAELKKGEGNHDHTH